MEFETKRKDNSAVKITVKNTPEEVAEAYKAAYVQAAKKVKVPGFRKGKVPLQTLRVPIDYGFNEAMTTWGVIGVKCWITKKPEEVKEENNAPKAS